MPQNSYYIGRVTMASSISAYDVEMDSYSRQRAHSELSSTLVGANSRRSSLSVEVGAAKESEVENQWGPEIFALMEQTKDIYHPSKQAKNSELALKGIGAWADHGDAKFPPFVSDDQFDQILLKMKENVEDILDIVGYLAGPLKIIKRKVDADKVQEHWNKIVDESKAFDDIYRKSDFGRRCMEGMPKEQDKKVDGRPEWGSDEERATGTERWDAYMGSLIATEFPGDEDYAEEA